MGTYDFYKVPYYMLSTGGFYANLILIPMIVFILDFLFVAAMTVFAPSLVCTLPHISTLMLYGSPHVENSRACMCATLESTHGHLAAHNMLRAILRWTRRRRNW